MNISAQLPGELAVGEEKERIHTKGSDIGTFWVSHHFQVNHEDIHDNGTYDLTAAYGKGLQEFFESDTRVREGHFFQIILIA